MKNLIKNNQGFTLIELIVSVAILGFLVVGFLNIFVYGTSFIGMARDKSHSSVNAQSNANSFMSDKSGSINSTTDVTLAIELISGSSIDAHVTEVTVEKVEDGQKSTIITIVP